MSEEQTELEVDTTPEPAQEAPEPATYPPLSVAACYKASLEDADGD